MNVKYEMVNQLEELVKGYVGGGDVTSTKDYVDVNTGKETKIITTIIPEYDCDDVLYIKVELISGYQANTVNVVMDKPNLDDWHVNKDTELFYGELNGDVVSVRSISTGANTLAIYVNGELDEVHRDLSLDDYNEIIEEFENKLK